MNEFQLIQAYFAERSQSLAQQKGVVLGIGDDCALLELDASDQLVVSVDTLVEGRHFPESSPPVGIASRAFCTALGDLAAMGAEPLWFTLALTLPEVNSTWLAQFSRGLFDMSEKYECCLVGGDTTAGPLTITVQVHGKVPKGQAITRSGALPGDSIFVSGALGDGAAGLNRLQATPSRAWPALLANDYVVRRFFQPEPECLLGVALRGHASAAIDISDGFLQDLGHICQASGCGAKVDIHRLPTTNFDGNDVTAKQALSWALAGGDDYRLCFTVPNDRMACFTQAVQLAPYEVFRVGVMTDDEPRVSCTKDGQSFSPTEQGYQHF